MFRAMAAGAAGLALLSAGLTGVRTLQAQRRYPPSGRVVPVSRGARLHVVDRGGPDRPVVLLHGNPGFTMDYTLTIFDAVAREHRALAIDRPGHGYSTRPRGLVATAEVQTELIRELLRDLRVDRPVIVGHSWSGAIALAYAVYHPDEVSGIVLLGAMTHPVPPGDPSTAKLLSAPIVGDFVRWVIWPWSAPAKTRANLVIAYGPEPVRGDHAAAAEALWPRPGQVRAVAQDQLTVADSLRRLQPRYGAVRLPVTIVYGTDDPWCQEAVQVAPLVAAIPHARVIALPGTGHELAHTRGEAVIRAIDDTWASALGG